MKLLRHPIHVMLIHFPAALFPMELACYFVFYKTGNASFTSASYYAMFGGVLLGCAAIITGAIDLFLIKNNSVLQARALIHGSINGSVVLTYSILASMLYKDYPTLPAATVIMIAVKAALNILMIAGNYLGRNLVLKYKIRCSQLPNTKRKMTTYQQLSEKELIDRIINGDIAVYEVLIRRYNPYLYRIGRSYGFNHQDVEDLMQEAFIHAYENLNTLENKAYFKTWLTRIMLNECYRKSNKASSRKEVVADTFLYEKSIPMFSGNNNSDTERNVGNRELNSIIENAINRIPIDYRMVFSLREMNGMSVLETAKALHITETNVKVRLNRAKAMLRKQLEKMYSPEDIFQFNLIYCDKIVAKVMERIMRL